jgi:uncharacterized protein
MRWLGDRESDNVEDRRGIPGGVVVGGGIGTVLFVIVALLLGADPQKVLQQIANNPAAAPGQGGGAAPGGAPAGPKPPEDEKTKFVHVVLGDTEDVWNAIFKQQGKTYVEPKLVLFLNRVDSACGQATSAVGPFYCPGDSKVYLDMTFFDELNRRFKAPGEFAEAYVIAHEIGHHVQNLLGRSRKFESQRRGLDEADANALSVRLELQADFYAGVWAHHAQKMKNILEDGDIESALRAATAIGDDTLQKQARGYVVPDTFTHGTSAQRVKWFRKGFETGDVRQGDTFDSPDL